MKIHYNDPYGSPFEFSCVAAVQTELDGKITGDSLSATVRDNHELDEFRQILIRHFANVDPSGHQEEINNSPALRYQQFAITVHDETLRETLNALNRNLQTLYRLKPIFACIEVMAESDYYGRLSSMSVLSVQSVSYSYKTKYQTVQAVKDVSCDLSAGTFYALVGKSGSGKTTLLSLLAGLDTPQSGDIIVGGQSLREIDVDIYRRKQASVIYQSYNLFPLMTVCENVMYPLKLLRHSDADAKKEAQIALEKVGLGESYWKRLPAMLSGGEQQRVAIARTLAVHAQIILADEPTGNLDTENSTQIIQLLSRLAHEENCCVVVVTHDLEVAKAADVVFRMDSGRLKEETV